MLLRILNKMKQIEENCVQDFGDTQTQKILLPLTQNMKPILRVLTNKLSEQGCGVAICEDSGLQS